MAPSLTTVAAKLHFKPETHEGFRNLCAYYIRAVVTSRQPISAQDVDTAARNVLETHGPVLWPTLLERRTHLLDTPDDTTWIKHPKKKAPQRQTRITGPRFVIDSVVNASTTGQYPILSSKLGKVVRQYVGALAKDASVLVGQAGEDAQGLVDTILGIARTDDEEGPDDLTIEVAEELRLRDSQAMETLALHHLRKIVPEIMGQRLDGQQLSNKEGQIEQAVVSFLDSHGAAFWPLSHREHLQRPTEQTKPWVIATEFTPSFSRQSSDGGPFHAYHGRMGVKEVERWVGRFRGTQPSEREMVACGKIGQVLKTYMTELLRSGQDGGELDNDQLGELVTHLLVQQKGFGEATASGDANALPPAVSQREETIRSSATPPPNVGHIRNAWDSAQQAAQDFEGTATAAPGPPSTPPGYRWADKPIPTEKTAADPYPFDADAFAQALTRVTDESAVSQDEQIIASSSPPPVEAKIARDDGELADETPAVMAQPATIMPQTNGSVSARSQQAQIIESPSPSPPGVKITRDSGDRSPKVVTASAQTSIAAQQTGPANTAASQQEGTVLSSSPPSAEVKTARDPGDRTDEPPASLAQTPTATLVPSPLYTAASQQDQVIKSFSPPSRKPQAARDGGDTADRPFKCPIETCKYHTYGFKQKAQLKTHCDRVHPGRHWCTERGCAVSTSDEQGLADHLIDKHGYPARRKRGHDEFEDTAASGDVVSEEGGGRGRFKCPSEDCERHSEGFKSQGAVKAHWTMKHAESEMPRFWCGDTACAFSAMSYTGLRLHFSEAHG